MLKTTLTVLSAALLMLGSEAFAKTLKIPAKDTAMIANVPNNWRIEPTDPGYLVESEDGVVTLLIEVANSDDQEALLKENAEWLVNENGVNINKKSERDDEFTTGNVKWGRLIYDGSHKEHGECVVGFLFTPAGKGKLLTATYWISKEGFKENMKEFDAILSSVEPIE